MNIGTLCFATERGLGYLAKSFYNNGIVTHPATLQHGSIPNLPQWYSDNPNHIHITTQPWLSDRLKGLISNVSMMLFFETPFDWNIIDYCRTVGVKTALITMYECTPEHIPYEPDLYICPSLLDLEFFPREKSVFIPVPVDEPWELRTKAINFVHNSGYIGLRGRSGTQELIDAIQYVKSPAKITIRSQNKSIIDMAYRAGVVANSNVTVEHGIFPYESLRTGMDVCIAPEKFNGLSLPLQECFASGMLVMTTNRFPANTWLPHAPMIPCRGTTRQRVNGRMKVFDESIIDPKDIAATIDKCYGQDIESYSLLGKHYADNNSWEVLTPIYRQAFEALYDSP